MKHRRARSLSNPGLRSLAALITVAALSLVQSTQAQSLGSAEARTGNNAQASTAAYVPEASRENVSAAREPARDKRKPRWFDERRQQAETTTGNSFERLSYTRYEGEAGQGSGSCVYYQSSYTYSCR